MDVNEESGQDQPRAGRRRLLRMIGGAAAAGAVAAAGGSKPASASTGNAMYSGYVNQADRTTKFTAGTASNLATQGNPIGSYGNVVEIIATAIGSVPLRTDGGYIGVSASGAWNGVYAWGAAGNGVEARGGTRGVFAWGVGPHTMDPNAATWQGLGVAAHGAYGLAALNGTKAHLYLSPKDYDPSFESSPVPKVAPPNRTDAHRMGEIDTDANGDLWYCVADGTPGTWRKLSGVASSGSLHLLATPQRVYDSRPTEPPASVVKGELAKEQVRTVSCAAAVPSKAQGVVIGLTAVPSAPLGYVAVSPGGSGVTGTSNLNWTAPGTPVAASVTVGVGDGATLDVCVDGAPGTAAHFIIDVFGFYL